ncbi:uncharacterized protein LOC107858742 [Capsicum annuum]|uniref:uncharacterized protein LOC107858742 n=1 Tax=Capsicum annuum TaxID=4072 RepID=UPI001FB0E459|nr:uncharacterized protein LOC107858742 [Capsicum annuum]
MDEPVLSIIQISSHHQSILYEGEGFLCIGCGRLGNTQEKCLYSKASPPSSIPSLEVTPIKLPSSTQSNSPQEGKMVKFPPRRRHQSGRTSTPIPTNNKIETKKKPDLSPNINNTEIITKNIRIAGQY